MWKESGPRNTFAHHDDKRTGLTTASGSQVSTHSAVAEYFLNLADKFDQHAAQEQHERI